MLTVGEAGSFAGEGEHAFFGFIEGGHAVVPQTAGVFQAAAEAQLVEAGGYFVVLFIGGLRLFGDAAFF